MNGHIHAELMALYAQDALEADKPWERWQTKTTSPRDSWTDLEGHPNWRLGWEYRRKPEQQSQNQKESQMNNQPAFPIVKTTPTHSVLIEKGMSLRDYFAAKAMQAWLTDFGNDYVPNEDKCARFAYKMADAMLAERECGGGE